MSILFRNGGITRNDKQQVASYAIPDPHSQCNLFTENVGFKVNLCQQDIKGLGLD